MKTGAQLAVFTEEIPSEVDVRIEIKDWIENNTFFVDQKYIWRIGITTPENLLIVEAKIRQNLECKHWRYWHAESFREAMSTIRQLHKYPSIFKSKFNQYEGKGSYVFIYKTLIPRKSDYFHTLRS